MIWSSAGGGQPPAGCCGEEAAASASARRISGERTGSRARSDVARRFRYRHRVLRSMRTRTSSPASAIWLLILRPAAHTHANLPSVGTGASASSQAEMAYRDGNRRQYVQADKTNRRSTTAAGPHRGPSTRGGSGAIASLAGPPRQSLPCHPLVAVSHVPCVVPGCAGHCLEQPTGQQTDGYEHSRACMHTQHVHSVKIRGSTGGRRWTGTTHRTPANRMPCRARWGEAGGNDV